MVARVRTDPNTAYIIDNVLNMLCDVSWMPSCCLADHACVLRLAASSFQGSAPLKPSDVAAMVNHRSRVKCGVMSSCSMLAVRRRACSQAALLSGPVYLTLRLAACGC